MAVCDKLKSLLDRRAVPFEVVSHPLTFSAQETAEELHTSGTAVAKSVVLKVRSWYALAVLPACQDIDFDRLEDALRGASVRLANEREFRELFPDCELGAMPPFGNLYGLPVYFSDELARAREIYFNGGTHTEAIRMRVQDYLELVQPVIMDFAGEGALAAHA